MFSLIAAIDLGGVGYFIVASFVAAWVVSVGIWKIGNYETRYSQGIEELEHSHTEIKLGS
jgi:high-affinity nickel-transport protein